MKNRGKAEMERGFVGVNCSIHSNGSQSPRLHCINRGVELVRKIHSVGPTGHNLQSKQDFICFYLLVHNI